MKMERVREEKTWAELLLTREERETLTPEERDDRICSELALRGELPYYLRDA